MSEKSDDGKKKKKGKRKTESLKLLRETTKALARGMKGVGGLPYFDPEMEDAAEDTLARVAKGVASQFMGIDEEGEPVLTAWHNVKRNWNAREREKRGLPKIPMVLPGLVTDTASLPNMLGNGPEWSKRAEEMAANTHDTILERMGLEPAQGFRQNAAESLGTMLAQIPITRANKAKPVLQGALAKLKHYGKKAALSPIEFFSPTIEPSISNYLMGAGAGGALASLGDYLGEAPEVEIESGPRYKAKGGKIKSFDRVVDAIRSRYPKPGVFSVLDNLIEEAPFERGTSEQWKAYLKPGREHIREDVRFPLRPDELRWGGKDFDDLLSGRKGSLAIDKDELLRTLRKGRIEFSSTAFGQGHGLGRDREEFVRRYVDSDESGDDVIRGPFDDINSSTLPKFGHREWRSPGDDMEDYHEWLTGIPTRDRHTPDYEGGHFYPSTVSWSRVQDSTERYLDPLERKSVRLIDELQSDLHQAATWKNPYTNERLGYAKPGGVRKSRADILDPIHAELNKKAEEKFRDQYGRFPDYNHDEDADLLDEIHHGIANGNPQLNAPWGGQPWEAPFRDEGWIRHELQKNLLEAAEQGDEGLAVVHPETVGSRYSDNPGLGKFYEVSVIPELRRLAQRYGAEMGESGGQAQKSNVRDGWVNARDNLTAIDVPDDAEDEYLSNIAEDVFGYLEDAGIDTDTIPQRAYLALRDALGEGNFRPGGEVTPDRIRTAVAMIRNHINDELESKKFDNISLKPNPTLKLTPELRDKIKRIGVPLFSTVGGISLMNDDQEYEDYAEGGKVRNLKGLYGKIYKRYWNLQTRLFDPKNLKEGEAETLRVERDRLAKRLNELRSNDPMGDDDYAEGGKVSSLKGLLKMLSINPDSTARQKGHMLGDETEEVLYATNEARRIGAIDDAEANNLRMQLMSEDENLVTEALLRLHQKLFPTPESLRKYPPSESSVQVQAEQDRLQAVRNSSGHGKISDEDFQEMLRRGALRKAKGGKFQSYLK